MKAKCRKCGETVEVTKPKEYKSCKCGAIGLDYGDEYYFRVIGDLKDFDGGVEDTPEVKDRTQTIDLADSPKAKTSDPYLENLADYFNDISNCYERLSHDFKHI